MRRSVKIMALVLTKEKRQEVFFFSVMEALHARLFAKFSVWNCILRVFALPPPQLRIFSITENFLLGF